MKNIIYYFTGTGNTLKIAKEIANGLGETRLIRIVKNMENTKVPEQVERIGILTPVYKGNIPSMVQEFLNNLQFQGNPYIFSLATCDAIDANTHTSIRSSIEQKSNTVSASFTILMPASNMTRRAPYSEEKQNKIIKQSQHDISSILPIIQSKEVVEYKRKHPLLDTVIGRIFKNYSPYDWDQSFYAEDSCIGCGICTKVCPANNIQLVDKKPEWKHQCESCNACLQLCPKQAIQFGDKTKKWGRYHHPEITIKELVVGSNS